MALIKCPDCGSDISSRAPSCPKCGYPISKSANRPGQGAPLPYIPRKKNYRKIILWSLLFTLAIILLLVYRNNKSLVDSWFTGNHNYYIPHNVQEEKYIPTEHTKYLVQGSIVARANEQYRHINFLTPAGSFNNKVTGRFQAYGGSGNDIRVFIMTQDEYTNFINGHKVETYYSSGRTTVDNLNVSLPSGYGTYTLVFDNFFSIVTDKEIDANIVLHCTY